MASSREHLLDAAKDLVWERGVEATSPAMLLARSGVGQGSLYHHFPGKAGWAQAAITALAADLQRETDALLRPECRGADRLRAYLTRTRAALDGCRLGRLAFDPAVVADPDLRAPIGAYFTHLRDGLAAAVADARADGDLRADLDPAPVAAAIAALVQGGYVTSRLLDQPTDLELAAAGFLAVLGI